MVGTPRVQRLSFSAIGTPANGPRSSPAARAASTAAAAASASSAITRLKAWISPSPASIAASASVVISTADRSPDRTAAASSTRGAHGASPNTGGTRNMTPSAVRRRGEHLVTIERRADDVLTEHVAERIGVRHRLDTVEVE